MTGFAAQRLAIRLRSHQFWGGLRDLNPRLRIHSPMSWAMLDEDHRQLLERMARFELADTGLEDRRRFVFSTKPRMFF